MSQLTISDGLVALARAKAAAEGRDLPAVIHELLSAYVIKGDDCDCKPCHHKRTLTWEEYLAIPDGPP